MGRNHPTSGGSGGDRDRRLIAAVAAILLGKGDVEDYDVVLEFAYQRAKRYALAKGITNPQDLEEIAEEVSLRLLEELFKRFRGPDGGPAPAAV